EMPFHVLEPKDGVFELPGCDPGKTYRVLIVDDTREPDWKGGPMPIGGGKVAVLPSAPNGLGLLKDTPGRVGALVEISAKKANGKPLTVKLQPCGKAEVRFVDADGKAARVVPWLELLVTPKQGKLPAEWMQLGRPNISPQPGLLTPDKEGRLTISGLIPGATYRLRGYDERVGLVL